ncbi:SprT family zinc-dependent metalloprotease [Blastomonas sp. AAP53]|uniref:M48 family metallopeptidase n=1 Tax=Blastomonas sp. AAP53 TaxID=1248760 RepID=UPI0002DCC500|nr:SprT family zinc-dependent metalloprotease [Blastomonas sp. AAP53]
MASPIARLFARKFAPHPAAAPAETPQRITIGERDYALVIRRHARARNIRLRTDPAKGALLLTLPGHARLGEAIAFARAQADWIEASFAKAGAHVALEPGATIPLRGIPHRIDWNEGHGRRVIAADGVIALGGARTSLDTRLTRWLKAEAKRLCAADLADYCARAGTPVPALAISNAARRWGSCSANGTIRINWRLVMAPDTVRRSVVAHEVAHLKHMNHSADFYAWLDALFEGDRQSADRWLKAHGRGLYLVGGAV